MLQNRHRSVGSRIGIIILFFTIYRIFDSIVSDMEDTINVAATQQVQVVRKEVENIGLSPDQVVQEQQKLGNLLNSESLSIENNIELSKEGGIQSY